MRIAIIGAGNVGATLGRRFADAGHVVIHGVRSPDDMRPAACHSVAVRSTRIMNCA